MSKDYWPTGRRYSELRHLHVRQTMYAYRYGTREWRHCWWLRQSSAKNPADQKAFIATGGAK